MAFAHPSEKVKNAGVLECGRLSYGSLDIIDKVVLDPDTIAGSVDKYQEQHAAPSADSHVDEVCASFLVQVNAQSLKCPSTGASCEVQFARAKVMYVGVQEARPDKTQDAVHGNFIVASSAAIRGQFGCEFWCNRTIPFGFRDHRPFFSLHRCL